jgi:hypothetical protein
MTRHVVSCILGAVAVGGFTSWRLHAPPGDRPIVRYVVADRSGSDSTPCVAVGRIVERAIRSGEAAGSRWHFFVTGTAESAFEPVAIMVQSSPASRRLIDGKDKADRENAAFVGDVVSACTTMPPAEKSPVFLAVKRVVEQARQLNVRAEVYAVTDLEETIEAQIVAALKAARGTSSPLPASIDNCGVSVHFCGYAETRGFRANEPNKLLTAPRTAERADRLLEVWRSLFTDPASVSFEPFCL